MRTAGACPLKLVIWFMHTDVDVMEVYAGNAKNSREMLSNAGSTAFAVDGALDGIAIPRADVTTEQAQRRCFQDILVATSISRNRRFISSIYPAPPPNMR